MVQYLIYVASTEMVYVGGCWCTLVDVSGCWCTLLPYIHQYIFIYQFKDHVRVYLPNPLMRRERSLRRRGVMWFSHRFVNSEHAVSPRHQDTRYHTRHLYQQLLNPSTKYALGSPCFETESLSSHLSRAVFPLASMSLRRVTTSPLLRSHRCLGRVTSGQRWSLQQHYTTAAFSAALGGTQGRSGGSGEQGFRDGFALCLATAGVSSAIACLTHHNQAKCEQQQEEEPYDVFSSSDPMDLPTQSEDGIPLEKILLTDIAPTKNTTQELEDKTSDFSKSMRAFGSCLESTAAIRRRDTPLATSKGDLTTEDRIATLGTHEKETVTTRNMYFYKASQIHDGMADRFVLLAGPSSEDLGGDIGHLLGVGVNRAQVAQFADG